MSRYSDTANEREYRGSRKLSREEKQTSWKHQLKRLPFLLLIPLGLLLPRLVQNDPTGVENVYSRSIYPVIARAVGAVSSLVPTSLAELIVIVIGALLIGLLVFRILAVIFGKLRNRRRNRVRLFSFLISVAIFAGVMLNLFYCMWGFNHYRLQVSDLLHLEVRDRSKEELGELCTALAKEAAELRETVAVDERGIFSIGDHAVAMRSVATAYTALGKENALFENKVYSAKSVIFSKTLSKLDIAGIYIPYTAEANVNTEQPDLYILSGAAHETAHYFGFAREDEASFLAFYASRYSSDAALRYSATMMALNYCANKLYSVDSELFFEIRSECYSADMIRDLADYTEYYKKYENHPAGKVNDRINDSYLKYNGQEDGLKSYGRMVDLLLAFYASGKM